MTLDSFSSSTFVLALLLVVLSAAPPAAAQDGKVDTEFLCLALPNQTEIERDMIGFPFVGFSWCETDNRIRFPTPLNMDLLEIDSSWKCQKEHGQASDPNDECFMHQMTVQELSNATLLRWHNASRREDMHLGLFVLHSGYLVIYETTTADNLQILPLPKNYTVRRIQTVRSSPYRFFATLSSLYEQMIVAFDSDRVDWPTEPMFIRDYVARRFIIRNSRLFAPGVPLADLSGQGNLTMPVKPPTAATPPTTPPTAESESPVEPPQIQTPVEDPFEPVVNYKKRALSFDAVGGLRNDSIYLIDLVIHGPSRRHKLLFSQLDPILRANNTVERIDVAPGKLFFAEIDLIGMPQQPMPQLEITQQPAYMSFDNLTKYRPLALVNDAKRVHIFQLERGLRSGALNWTDSQAPSLFYTVQNKDHKITAASMFVESVPRLSGNFFAGSPMWLVVSLTSKSNGNSSIHFIFLPEMSVHFEQDVRFDDPAQMDGTPAVLCPNRVHQYYDAKTDSCIPRMQLWHQLSSSKAPSSIITRAVERFVTDVYLPKPLPSAVNIWPAEKPGHTAIFVTSDRGVEVFGVAPNPYTSYDVSFQKMSSFSFMGPVRELTISPNGIHVFANVYRSRWELDAMNRFADICVKLENPDLPALERQILEKGFAEPCSKFWRRPNVNDFLQYVGMCPTMGLQCYSFYRTLIQRVKPGYYTDNAFEQLPCPAGSFCPAGLRQSCPPGFICPGEFNIRPTKCITAEGVFNQTCYSGGLSRPMACPPGTACVAPFLPPLPASPGHYMSDNASRTIVPCRLGEYCLLGRSQSEDRLCPDNFVCNQTDVIVPQLCECNATSNYCSYCPKATFIEKPCPAGHYCRPSNTSVECHPPLYCPEGTLAPELCPAGYYCSNTSSKIICPAGYFCPIGSISPSKCSVFTVCNEGAKDHAANFIVLVVAGIVLIAVVTAWKVSGRIIDKRRARTLKEAQERIAEKKRRISNLSQAASDDSEHSEEQDILQPDEHTDLAPLLQVSDPSNYVIDISFDHLGLVLPSGKAVLNGVTGEIRNSRVTAVMGPSGAGKTTFMTTLAGKAHYGKTVGDVFINGQKGQISKIKSLTGFVPQEDIMLRELTVRELLTFNADMRLPSSMTAEERKQRIDTVLDVLGLSHLQYSIIGDESKRGISGGQRKRVNIGIELVANPRILFLDEPTSGLDSTSSMEVVHMLSEVSRKEQIPIVTVIHQPRYDIFTMFDDVLLLGPGGTTVYLGPSQLALSYFEMLGFKAPATANPADFFMDVISGSIPREGHPEFQREDLFALWKQNRARFAEITGTYLPGSEPPSLEGSLLEDSENMPPPSPQLVRSLPSTPMGSFSAKSRTSSLSSSGHIQLDDFSHADSRTESFRLPKTAKRKRPNAIFQLGLFFVRALLQQMRNIPGVLADVVLVLMSAVTFGIVFYDTQYMGPPPAEVCDRMPVEGLRLRCSLPVLDPFPHMSIMTSIGLALPAAMAALRVFGPERVVFWRESSAGSNTFSYFLGKDLAQYPGLILLPLLFTGVFATFWSPRGPFVMFWLLFMLVWWVSTGIGYVISVFLPPNLATMGAVVVIFGFSMFAGIKPTLKEMASMWIPMPWLPWISPFRYASEAFYLIEIAEWSKIYDITTGLNIMGYADEHKTWWLLVLAGMGLFWRLVAMVALEIFDRKRRQ